MIIRDYDNEEENETISENLISLVTLLKGLDEDETGAISVNPLGLSIHYWFLFTDVAKEHPAEPLHISQKKVGDASPSTESGPEFSSPSASNGAKLVKPIYKKDLDENGEEIEEI